MDVCLPEPNFVWWLTVYPAQLWWHCISKTAYTKSFKGHNSKTREQKIKFQVPANFLKYELHQKWTVIQKYKEIKVYISISTFNIIISKRKIPISYRANEIICARNTQLTKYIEDPPHFMINGAGDSSSL